MKRKTVIGLGVLLGGVALMLGISLLAVRLINAGADDVWDQSASASASAPMPDAPANSVPAEASSAGSIASQAPALPDRMGLALPENGLISDEYFNNVTFVGDSISQGLQWGVAFPDAHHCTYKSIGPKGIYDGTVWTRPDGTKEAPMEAIVASQPDNVYVLVGANAIINMEDDVFLAYYSEMLDAIRANLHPEVCIYVQSITPVLQGVDERFDMARINALNDALARLAAEKGLYFLNLGEVLAAEDGWLKPEYGAADGYHLTNTGYSVWAQYLRTHTATHRRHKHLYLEGPASEPQGSAAV